MICLTLRLVAIHEMEVEVEVAVAVSQLLDHVPYKDTALFFFPVRKAGEIPQGKGLQSRTGLRKLELA